jgi:hypothetical protein
MVDVSDEKWDAGARTLSAESQVVGGDLCLLKTPSRGDGTPVAVMKSSQKRGSKPSCEPEKRRGVSFLFAVLALCPEHLPGHSPRQSRGHLHPTRRYRW